MFCREKYLVSYFNYCKNWDAENIFLSMILTKFNSIFQGWQDSRGEGVFPELCVQGNQFSHQRPPKNARGK